MEALLSFLAISIEGLPLSSKHFRQFIEIFYFAVISVILYLLELQKPTHFMLFISLNQSNHLGNFALLRSFLIFIAFCSFCQSFPALPLCCQAKFLQKRAKSF